MKWNARSVSLARFRDLACAACAPSVTRPTSPVLAQRRERRREKAEIRNVAVKDRTKVTSASFKAAAAQRETAQSQRRENDRDRSKKRKRERTGRGRKTEAGSSSSYHHDSRDVRRQHKADRTDKDEVVASGDREGDSNDSGSYSDSAVEDYRIYEPPKKRRVDSVQRSIRLVAEGVTKASKHPLARARHIAPQGRVTVRVPGIAGRLCPQS